MVPWPEKRTSAAELRSTTKATGERSCYTAGMLARALAWVDRTWPSRTAQVGAATLRLALGFAFLPAGLKKLIGQPFTDPHLAGPFHNFLHAFHATGGFYRAVGVLQLAVALLLLTQRYAWFGAVGALPILSAIVMFCWSTAVYPTATVATLMWFAALGLAIWDRPRARPTPPIAWPVWAGAGVAIVLAYLALCIATGEVYRPRKVDAGDPAFYVMPAIALTPLAAWWIERRRRRRAAAS